MIVIFLATYLVLIFPIFLTYLLFKREWEVVILASLSALVTKLLEIITGKLFYVQRPFILDPKLPYYKDIIDGPLAKVLAETGLSSDSSFFSTHAGLSFAVSSVVYFKYNKNIGLFLLISAGLVGIGRILANLHYPIDVIVGGVIGVIVAYVSLKTFETIKRKKKLSTGLTISTLCGKLLK